MLVVYLVVSLYRMFITFQDRDGCLSPTEVQRLFSTCPQNPWGPEVYNSVCTNPQGWLSLQGYLAQWTYVVH